MPTRVSERMWRERYDRWKSSGLSLPEFAAREKVKKGSWTYWTRRMDKIDREATSSMTFIRVADGESSGSGTASAFEVLLPNAVRLRVPCDAPMRQVTELIKVLGAARFH